MKADVLVVGFAVTDATYWRLRVSSGRRRFDCEVIWAPSEIPPKCKLQRLEKEQCVADAEKFIAEFYRHKFIK